MSVTDSICGICVISMDTQLEKKEWMSTVHPEIMPHNISIRI